MQVLLYVIDMSVGTASDAVGREVDKAASVEATLPYRTPVQQLLALHNELSLFSPALADRPALIAANKLDCEGVLQHGATKAALIVTTSPLLLPPRC